MLKLMKNFTKKEIILIIMSIILIVVQVWLELKMPDYMSEITKLVETEGSQMSDVLTNGKYMMLCALGSLVSSIIVGYLVATIAANLSKNIRKKLFDKVQDLATSEVKKFSTSSLITRSTNDITQIQMLFSMGLHLIIKSPITAAWAIVKILNKSWEWSAITGVAVVVLLSVGSVILAIVVPKFKILQKLTDKLNGVTRENLTGIRVVRAFNAEKYQEEKFDKVNGDLTKLQLFNQKCFAIMQPLMYGIMNILTLLVYFVGANLINQASLVDKLSIFGNMIVFSSYAIQVILSFLLFALIFMMFPRGQVSAKRINEVLDEKITVKDGALKTGKKGEVGTIEFKNVSFKYPDAEEYLLSDISFKVNRGDFVAIIGLTGSGKSTLINLIPRFYDVTDGEVIVDGRNVKEYTGEALHNKIGYVPQKAVIFDGTVKFNVGYGDNGKADISERKIREAVEVAQAKEFVEKLDLRYDTHISQGGTNLSGGQKQRLAIARTLLKDTKIILFDEATSALDNESQEYIKKTIDDLTKTHTIIIVAHRLSTIQDSDLIYMIDNGKVVDKGTHDDLMISSPLYQKLYTPEVLDF